MPGPFKGSLLKWSPFEGMFTGPFGGPAGSTFLNAETVLSLNGTDYDLTSRYLGRQATATTWVESGAGTKNETLTFTGTATSQYLRIEIPGVDDESAAFGGLVPGGTDQCCWQTTAAGRPDLSAGSGFIAHFIIKDIKTDDEAIFTSQSGVGADGVTLCYISSSDRVQTFVRSGASADTGFTQLVASPGKYREYWIFFEDAVGIYSYVNGEVVRTDAITTNAHNGTRFALGGAGTEYTGTGGKASKIAFFEIWEGITDFGSSAQRDAVVSSMSILPAQPSTFDGLPTKIKLNGTEHSLTTRFSSEDATTSTWADTGQGTEPLTLSFVNITSTSDLTVPITGVSDITGALAGNDTNFDRWQNLSPGTVLQMGYTPFVIHMIVAADAVTGGSIFTNGITAPNKRWTLDWAGGAHSILGFDSVGPEAQSLNTVAVTTDVWYEVWYFVNPITGVTNRYVNRGARAFSTGGTLTDECDGGLVYIGGTTYTGASSPVGLFEYFRLPDSASFGTDAEQKAIVDALSLGNV